MPARRLLLLAAALLMVAAVARPASAPARPLVTSLIDPATFGFDETPSVGLYRQVRATGARMVRIQVSWIEIAPDRPANPADPGDPAYRWDALDARVGLAMQAGLVPLISVASTPPWAVRPDRWQPFPAELATFMRALALRYDRVRYWQVWNEPNLGVFIDQQEIIEQYREMVNAVADAVKGVRASNQIVAGGLSPLGGEGSYGSPRGSFGYRPLAFMRELLCVPPGNSRTRTCSQRVRFDIWSHHPYTSGGPTHSAVQPDDVSLGDLPEMKRLLDRAGRLGAIASPRPARFWVTEFSWDTNPPDPEAVPIALHARWVSEALYRMWRSGISQVTWFQLRDEPMSQTPSGFWQAGLYFADGRAKPSLRAFRFPFVAFRSGRAASVWGRTPRSDARRVRIQQRRGKRWRTLRTVRSDRDGIFKARVRRRGGGPLRARVAGDVAQPFSLLRPPDLPVNPFGTPPR